ncbi:MAG: DUF1460 domain-containing protein [Candidatus Hydrogenedentes bacterium]|nr:DUF1460 domain-containing protein [Candidatus Hydrogenedentota bacterium]
MPFLTATLLAFASLAGGAPADVDAYLHDLFQSHAGFDNRLLEVIRQGIDTPYQDGPLGEGPDGKHDRDPLIDLSHVDCVTYVEQSIALAACPSYDQAFQKLQEIRYKEGKIDFETRNHFMIADWIPNNGWVKDATGTLGVDLVSLTRTISKRDFFPLVKAPELGQDTPDQTYTVQYVPANQVAAALPKMPSPALVLLIGAKPDWLFVVHCGFFVREADGTGKLYHASSKAGKVVAQDLEAYLKDSTRHLGFKVYTIGDPGPAASSETAHGQEETP